MTRLPKKIPPRLIAEHDQNEALGLEWWTSLPADANLEILKAILVIIDKGPPTVPITDDNSDEWVVFHLAKMASVTAARFAILAQQQEDEDEPEK